jgi:shikimate dehydrogenase
MHAAALADLRAADPRFEGWEYFRFDVPPEDLAAALDLMRERGFRGVNLTVPHKVLAMELVSEVDAGASAAGAVNTLLLKGAGWRGFNTDGYGLSAGIRESLGLELGGAQVVLLGAGGAARGAAVECLRAGCSSLWIMNRSRPNMDALLSHLTPLAPSTQIRGIELGSDAPGLEPGAIVINATTAGLKEADPAPVNLATLPKVAAVYDMIYNPPRTALLAQAQLLRLPNANGLGMLVHQGAKALEIWSGVPAAKTAPIMRAAASKALG